ncbi:MAG TPA: hypothetical protein VFD52_04795 [Clostridia bacterium]|nr:hypothetical protein [Clostridia bacterium]
MDAILFLFFLTFVILGIVASLYYVMLRVLQPGKDERYSVVLVAQKGDKQAAGKLCAVNMRLSLLGDGSKAKVILVDCGMGDEERRICERMGRESDNVYICKPDKLEKYIMEM